MFSKDQILKALSKVIHPEKKKDIVTLGMITEVESVENGISLTLTPDKSNDPFITSIKSTTTLTKPAARALSEPGDGPSKGRPAQIIILLYNILYKLTR